jgi:hypothetical protein
MIKSVDPQVVGPAELVTRKEVYFEPNSPVFNNETAITPVTFVPSVRFKLNIYTLESVRNADGVMEDRLVLYKSNDAIFKLDRWHLKYGSIVPFSEFFNKIDEHVIEEILFVNARTRNNEWTGTELQRVSYWHETITQASDLQIGTWDKTTRQWVPRSTEAI